MRNRVGLKPWVVASLAAIAALAASGCSKSESTPTELSAPAKLLLLSGDGQTVNGPVAAPLPLVVRITDPKDRGVANVSVTWSASDPTASLSATTTTTDTTGRTQVTWTLGQSPGRQTVSATTARIAGAQAVFQALNGVTTQLVIVSGDNQVGDVATALAAPLVVKATDVLGHPATGIAVSWSAVGGGAVTPASQVTDAQGQASASWTLAPNPGTQSASAQSAGPPAVRAVFVAGTGASISGGVTVQASLPLSFSTTSTHRGAIAMRRSLGSAAAETRRLIVQFKPAAFGMSAHIASGVSAARATEAAMQRVLAEHQARGFVSLAEPSPVVLAARVTVPAGVSVADASAALRNDASIESVTPDDILPMLESYTASPYLPPVAKSTAPSVSVLAGAVTGLLPNDPLLFAEYWHYNMVGAPRAWTKTTGSTNVLVAVVDVGVRFDHPAVSPNFTNDGYNFVTGGNRLTTAQPLCSGGTTMLPEAGPGPDPTAPDDLGFNGTCWSRSTIGDHGLHVSGTIGAVGNDGIGTAGIAWQVKIRPVRVLDITGSGSFFDIAQGVLYAAGLAASNGTGTTVTAPSGAAIINMSLGGYSSSPTLANAVIAATGAGSLIIASAGNSETNFPAIPASYPQVLAVSALGPDMQLSGYTNVGPNVSLAAPGGEFRTSGSAGVASTTWNYVTSAPGYAYYEGTSMAAPHVSGVAALVLAANPGLTGAQLRDRLQSTAVHLGGPGRDDRFGFGLVNAYNAVTNTTGPTRAAYVRIVNAVTGDAVRTVAVRADGSYAAAKLDPGSYYVVGGEDESADQVIGMPGRRFGWYGPAGSPTAISVSANQNAAASFSIGAPLEAKPHGTLALANRLVMNGYMLGQVTSTDPTAIYTVQIAKAGTYYFETGGILGTCGFGIELDTVLSLLDANGATLATNDDTVFPGSIHCSQITSTLPAGTFYLQVTGFGTATGQYRIWVRDQP